MPENNPRPQKCQNSDADPLPTRPDLGRCVDCNYIGPLNQAGRLWPHLAFILKPKERRTGMRNLRGTVFLVEVLEDGRIDYEARVLTVNDCKDEQEFRDFVAAELEGRLEFGPIGEPWGCIR
jgi:hypothetical protein